VVLNKKTQKPLADVKLSWRRDCCNNLGTVTTNADGKADMILPPGPLDYLNVGASKDHFVPLRVSWNKKDLQNPFPTEYTFSLSPGTSIGGIIKNEKGQPIEGATVFILVPSSSQNGEKVDIWDYPVKTNAQGQWRCDILPADMTDVWIRLAHPDYVSDNMYGGTPKPPMESLRNLSGVMVMKKGPTVKGLVVDKSGKPIAGVQVSQGSDRWGSHYPDTRTNAKGEFEFKNVTSGTGSNKLILTVQADGFAPDLKEIDINGNMQPVKFVLDPARTIKGRLVDSAGKPIAGAFIAADTWRGHRSIEWRVDTDSEGRFCWKNAPADEVLFDMGKQNFMSLRHKALTPSDEEYVITLNSPLKIHGSVTDAKTGKPISEFKVVPGMKWDSDQIYWEYRDAKTFRNGTYEIIESEPRPGHLVRIESPGYKRANSRVIKDNEMAVACDFKLEKDTLRKITVLLPDGKPAAGAQIAIATPSQTVFVQNGMFEDRMNTSNVLTTDAKGVFSLPSQTEAYKIVIIHDLGCAVVSEDQIKTASEIKLSAWGSVEGTVFIGAKPAADQILNLGQVLSGVFDKNTPRCDFRYSTNSDMNGHFTFTRVFPGDWQASRGVRHGNMVSYTAGENVTVSPGQTSLVIIGGKGRPVIGKIVLPAGSNLQTDWTHGFFNIRNKEKKLAVFDKIKNMGVEERKKWYETWKNSKEGKAYEESSRKNRRAYSFVVNPDGTFHAEDIPAGIYTLSVQLYAPPASGSCGWGENLGSVMHEFTIPEMPGGRSDKPLDLGKLELQLKKTLKSGVVAPDFEVKTIDGKTIKLRDFRGKYVLLDFWATWCGPCVGEIPNLKEVYKKFGSDKHFVMISLSLDHSLDDLKPFVKKENLKWLQGYLGDWSKTKVPDAYGVDGIPSIFLINPDGEIIEKDLRGQAIATAVEKALKK
jgi:peroxiredoxin